MSNINLITLDTNSWRCCNRNSNSSKSRYEIHLQILQDWIFNDKTTFALKVTGDSMNDIGIDKWDTVIVHQQRVAINGDIVIAIINQEATMKKFTLMGDSVLLLSENNSYEPIQMKREDIIINGKVIGV